VVLEFGDYLAQEIINICFDYAQTILATAGGLIVIGLVAHLVAFVVAR
jgi:hypothetical protein